MRIIPMKKFTLLLLTAGLLLNLPEASARLRSLTEWNSGMPGSTVAGTSYDGFSAAGENGPVAAPLTAEQYCPKVCPGYKTDIEECEEGYELTACRDSDCGAYVKCTVIVCDEGYDTGFKDCPISVQDDNYHCTKCVE